MIRRELALRAAVTFAVVALGALFLLGIDYDWHWGKAWEWRRTLFRALWVTIWISALSLVAGCVLGFIFAMGRMSKNVVFNQLSNIYVEFIRGTPLLVQLIVLYYGIAPQLGLNNEYVIAIMGLAIFAGAYVAEICRAGIQSIARGQTEAARSLGMTRAQVMRHVIVPQMIPRILPPLTGQFISNIKDSSLLSVIAVNEVTKATRDAASAEALSFEFYVPLAFMYLAITLPLSIWNRRLEERLSVGS